MADVSEQPVNAGGCLGRVLTWIGSFWMLLIVVAGLGAFRGAGPVEDLMSLIGGSFVPALVLLAAGRALTKRAKKATETVVGSKPRPVAPPPPPAQKTPPPLAQPTPRPPVIAIPAPEPRPITEAAETPDLASPAQPEFDPAAETMFDLDFDFDIPPGEKPKTSQEMLEEAKRRLKES